MCDEDNGRFVSIIAQEKRPCNGRKVPLTAERDALATAGRPRQRDAAPIARRVLACCFMVRTRVAGQPRRAARAGCRLAVSWYERVLIGSLRGAGFRALIARAVGLRDAAPIARKGVEDPHAPGARWKRSPTRSCRSASRGRSCILRPAGPGTQWRRRPG